jgi:uncharacterized protein (UPF0216 family)
MEDSKFVKNLNEVLDQKLPKQKKKLMETFGSEPKEDKISDGKAYYEKLKQLLMTQVK